MLLCTADSLSLSYQVDRAHATSPNEGHQGVTKTRNDATSSVWWTGISQTLRSVARNCVARNKYRRESIEQMKGTEVPVDHGLE